MRLRKKSNQSNDKDEPNAARTQKPSLLVRQAAKREARERKRERREKHAWYRFLRRFFSLGLDDPDRWPYLAAVM